MSNRQALGIDIDENSRTGGINFELAKKHVQNGVYDFLIIKAGLGLSKSPLLDEQRKNAELQQIPFLTYHLPDPRFDLVAQAQKYADWAGTLEPFYIVDVEKPARDARPRSRSELHRYIDELVRLTQKEPILYSRADLLKDIGFVVDAKQFRWWIAQYLFDMSKLPNDKLEYRYFHDFLRDYEKMLPPSIFEIGLEDNVLMWQFTEKGNGPYYIYNRITADPNPDLRQGVKEADLNISMQGRDEFMQSIFGVIPQTTEAAGTAAGGQPAAPTFPGITNQDLINLIYTASRPFTSDPWVDFVVAANLESLAMPESNRDKPYTGPKIEDMPAWTDEEKKAVLRLINAPSHDDPQAVPTFPGMTNQDMVNLIFTAARPFTRDPWTDWILPARLGFLAVPSGNRRKPYTGPKVENFPNLTDIQKAAILKLI